MLNVTSAVLKPALQAIQFLMMYVKNLAILQKKSNPSPGIATLNNKYLFKSNETPLPPALWQFK